MKKNSWILKRFANLKKARIFEKSSWILENTKFDKKFIKWTRLANLKRFINLENFAKLKHKFRKTSQSLKKVMNFELEKEKRAVYLDPGVAQVPTPFMRKKCGPYINDKKCNYS